MTKHSFRSIIKSFTFLAFITLLTSCEGFFTNNDVDDKIRAAIDYANTPFSTFVVSADSNAGTIIPSGQVQYKPTDLQNIEFTCNSTYEFLGWDFSYKQTAQAADTPTLTATDKDWWKDYITIIKETESEANKDGKIVYTLQIRFDKAAENLLIQPKCGKKPQVEKLFPDAPSSSRSISRDTEISITFDSLIDPESINGSIIIKVDGVDCTDSFTAPVISTTGEGNSKKTTVLLNPIEQLSCPQNETAKVTIELKETIKTPDGVSLTPQILVYYINPSSSIKSYVDLGGTYEGGTLSPNSSPYEFDNKSRQLLTFNENSDYKFLHWECNNSNIIFDSDISDNPIMFYTLEELKRIELAKITPVFIKRPVFREARYSVTNVTVQPRDTDIKLIFDNVPSNATLKIPDDAVFAIDCSGKGSVISSFEAPAVDSNNKNQINIKAYKDSKRIQVTEDTDVYITIPDSIYYVFHDDVTDKDVNVTLGKSVKVSYTIGNTTQDKANVTFSRKNGENFVGNLFYNNAKMTEEEKTEEYNIDKTVSLKFEPDSNYEFLYWYVDGDNVEIDDKFSTQTTITVKGAGDVNIYPKCAPKLTAVLEIPAEYYSTTKNGYYSNSDIWIKTNIKPQAFDIAAHYGNSYNCITVTFDGNNVTSSNYELPVIVTQNGNTYIKLASKHKLPVPAGTSAPMTVSIRIDRTLYYNCEDTVINDYLGYTKQITIINNGENLTFNVIEDTKEKFYVKFEQIEGITADTAALDRYKADDWDTTKLYVLNESSDIGLIYTLQDTYQFIDWTIKDSSNAAIDSTIAKITTSTLYGFKNYSLNLLNIISNTCAGSSPDNPIIITAVCVPKLTIESYTPVTTGTDAPDSVARDSNITITFNVAPPVSIKNYISITCDGSPANKYFDISNATISGKTITIKSKPDSKISVPSGTTKTVQVTIVGKASYQYTLNGSSYDIPYIGDPFEYEINENTSKKINIKFQICNINGALISTDAGIITYNDQEVTLNTVQEYNVDSIIKNIKYIPTEDFNFSKWVITPTTSSSYTLNSDTSNPAEFKVIDESANTIVIQVRTTPRYCVKDISPQNIEGGVSCDSSIELYFNRNLSGKFNSSTPFNGITIATGLETLNNCYQSPVLTTDITNQIYKITIKSKYNGGFDRYFTSSYIPITVTIDSPLVDEKQTFTYYANRTTETNPPEVTGFTVKKVYDADETCVITEPFTSYGDDISKIKRNWANKLYFEGTVTDTESGLRRIDISEQRIRSVTGDVLSDNEIFTSSYFIDGTTKDLIDFFKGENYYRFKSEEDGVVNIKVTFIDRYGNTSSPISFDIVKDTAISNEVELVNLSHLSIGSAMSGPEGIYYNIRAVRTRKEYKDEYRNILVANKRTDNIIKTLSGTLINKDNIHNIDEEENIFSSMRITDIQVKHGDGPYITLDDTNDCGNKFVTNDVTPGFNFLLEDEGDFYSRDLKIIGDSQIEIPDYNPLTLFIQSNPNEDIYIKYITEDDIGNTKETIKKIPHIARIVNVTLTERSPGPTQDTYKYYFSDKLQKEDYYYIFNYAANGNSTVLGGGDSYTYERWNTSSAAPKSFTTYIASNNCLYYYTYKCNFNLTYDSVDSTIFTAVDVNNQTVPIPSYKENGIEVIQGSINSGYYDVSVQFNDTSHNYYTMSDLQYNYFIQLTEIGNSSNVLRFKVPQEQGDICLEDTDFCYYPLQDFSFKVSGGKKYNLSLVIQGSYYKPVKDDEGQIVHDAQGHIVTVSTPFEYTSSSKLIDCSYDNTPPVIALDTNNAASNGNCIFIFGHVVEDHPLKLSTGEPYMYYLAARYSLTEEEFDNSPQKRVMTYSQTDNILYFPSPYQNAGILYIKIFDSYGNSHFYDINIGYLQTKKLQKENYGELTSIEEKTISNGKLYYYFEVTYPETIYADSSTRKSASYYLSYYAPDEKHFVSSSTSGSNAGSLSNETNLISSNAPVASTKDGFIKLLVEEYTPKDNRAIRTPPVYFCPKYHMENITCNVKALHDVNGVITLLCDQPTLIQTYFSDKNYGTDIMQWEVYGGAVNEKVTSSSINYTADALCINEGDYYITVAYFADGTRIAGKVHQK